MDGLLYAVAPEGAPLWTFDAAGPIFSAPCAFTASLGAGLERRLLVTSQSGRLLCVDAVHGALRWEQPAEVHGKQDTYFLSPNQRSRDTLCSAVCTVFLPVVLTRGALNTPRNTVLPPSCRRIHRVGARPLGARRRPSERAARRRRR